MSNGRGEAPVRRVIGVSLNAAIDRIVSVPHLEPGRIHRPVARAVVPGGKAANTVRAASTWACRARSSRSWAAMPAAGTGTRRGGGHPAARRRGRLRDADLPVDPRRVRRDADRAVRGGGDAQRPRLGDGRGGARGGARGRRGRGGRRARGEPAARRAARRVPAARGPGGVGGRPGRRGHRRRPVRSGAGAAPWLVKVNLEEAASILGLERRRTRWLRPGARPARGADRDRHARARRGGARGAPDWTWRLGPVPEDARGPYSVGSGDAFTAGWLAGLAAATTS